MARIRMTAKRQATFPRALCEELKLAPGDSLVVEKRIVEGRAVWCLAPIPEPDLSWMGRFKKQAQGKKHDMASIRRSIQRARMKGDV